MTITHGPTTILGVEAHLRDLAANGHGFREIPDAAGQYAYLFGLATAKLAEAYRDLERMEKARRMVTVCSWCPDAIERTADARANGFDVTHGMCDHCAQKWSADRG